MTTKFIVKYSEEKDLQVYLDALWKPIWTNYGKDRFVTAQKYFPLDFLEKFKNAPDKNSAINEIKIFWKSTRVSNFEENTHLVEKWFNLFINKEKSLIIDRLQNVYKQPFPFEEIYVYLTTYISNPYNYEQRYFMTGRNTNLLGFIGVATHELNHFMFYHYCRENLIKKGYSTNQIEYLKESFAILTTNNLQENQDKPDVLPIQNFVKENSNKSVEEIIDLVIKNKLLDNIK